VERLIAALAALALAAAPAVAPPVVVPPAGAPALERVVVRAPSGEDAAALERAVPLRPGEPLGPRAVRRAVELLYGAGRCGDVVARLAPAAPGRALLVLECAPRRTVGAVRLSFASPSSLPQDRLRRAAGLAPGDELWPGRLEAAAERVRAACARAGYPAATVRSAAQGERQAQVEVAVDPGSPTRVASVELGDAPPPVVAAVATRPGGVLDRDVLDADLRAVRAALRRDGWLRARVGTPTVAIDASGAHVAIPVERGPLVAFRFVGNDSVAAAELRGQLGLDAEPALDAAAIEASAGRLRAAYQARGFADARVTGSEVATGSGVTVLFEIEEGRRYRVRTLHIAGAAERGEAWARERFLEALEALAPADPGAGAADVERLALATGTAPARRAPPPVAPGEVWDPPLWDAAAARVLEAYRADGYLEAAYDGTAAALDARGGLLDAVVRLREGVQTRVESITFDGASSLSAAEVGAEARIAAGDPLSFAALEATRASLLALYARRGHLYARVEDAEELSPDRRRARVRFRVTEGPRVRVGAIVVAGARRTREDVVKDVLALRAGDVYDPDAAARSQAALLRLGAFRSVGLRLSDPDVPEATKDLTVDIAERPWRTVAPGIGFSLANGPRAFVELLQPNLFGRALELSARAKVNYPPTLLRSDLGDMPFFERTEGRFEVGLHEPRAPLLGTIAGARVDAIAERLHRPSYDLSRASTIFGLELPAAQRVSVTVQYELEIDHIVKPDVVATIPLTRADVEQLRFPEGVTTLHSVRPVLALDWRDDPLRPRRGWFASATADWSHSIGNQGGSLLGVFPGSEVFTHIVKLSSTISGYLPLGNASAVAVSLRGGRVFPLEDGTPDRPNQTIGPKRFFLGGAATMRGYGEDEMIPEDLRAGLVDCARVGASPGASAACAAAQRQLATGQALTSDGGEAFALGKAELRIPLRESLELGVFADVGNLWLDPARVKLTDVRLNFGAGLRFATPIGPAVLDVGFNPSADRRLNEAVVAPHFSIGVF
jgi:outer membrane protein assembly factor BamA